MASTNPNSFNSYDQQPDKSCNTSQFSNFTSLSSNNTSTQSVAGSTPHLSSKEPPSFNLLQTLLKPQPPTSVADLEKSFGNMSGRAVGINSSSAAAVSSSPLSQGTSNPIDQLKRMMSSQSSTPNNSEPLFQNMQALLQQPQQQQQQQQQPQLRSFSNASMSRANEKSPIQTKALSVQSSPPLSNASEVIVGPSAVAAARKSGATSGGGTPSNTSKPKNAIDKKARLQNLVIDVKKVKVNAKPETVLISILQQPARFRSGRLISVSREYICYAVRSKEGGRIRVIHQLQGQLAKMVGHTDSIIDMAFHPCSSSKDPNMPQVLASLGKDDRLIVWLVGPVDLEAASAEGAISYEPFINVESGGDARFTCLAWREQIVDDSMELCVGTDKGFMIVKAPMPTSSLTNGVNSQAGGGGGGSSEHGENLSITPVDTTYAVTAIERAGLRWVFTATAEHSINLYELDSHWETCSQPYRHVCKVTKCEHSVDTLVYIAPTTAADGAGHLIVGHSMNKQIQLWWLGNNASQISLLQTLTFAGISTQKPAQVFSKLAWSEQCRCLTISSSHAPSAIFVLHPSSSGSDMYFNYPQGYSLGDDSLTLSMVAAEEQSQDEENSNSISSSSGATSLSIYGVHTRLVQQLQIEGIKPAPAKASNLPDPSDVYNGNAKAAAAGGYVRLSSQQPPGGDGGAPSVSATPTTQALGVAEPKKLEPAISSNGADITAELKKTIDTAVSIQVQSAMTELKLEDSRQAKSNDVGSSAAVTTISLDKGAESELVDRISAEVERRVTKSMSTVMEQTLIPAYSRATAAMFEQMQSTFEAGLREWWMRFAQIMPPPPPHPHHPMNGGTPLSHGVIMPQPQPQPQPQQPQQPQQQQNQAVAASGPSTMQDPIMSMMGNNIGMQQKSPMAQQSLPQSMSMSMPRPASNLSSTNATAGSNHIESLRNILNFQQQQQPMTLMDPAIAALGEQTNTSQGASAFPSK